MTVNEKVDLELHARFFDSELGFGLTKNIKPDSVGIVNKGQKIVVGPIARIKINDNISLNVKAYYRTLLGQFWYEEPIVQDSAIPGYWKSRSQDWLLELQGVIAAGKHNVLTTGIEYLGNNIYFGKKINTETDSIIAGTYSVNDGIYNGAVYIQDEISIADKINIVPGFRIDYHSDFRLIAHA